jgi:hypothetical protein
MPSDIFRQAFVSCFCDFFSLMLSSYADTARQEAIR